MNLVNLDSILTFYRGITFKPDDKVDVGTDDSVVCLRTKNIQKELDESDLLAVPSSFVKRDELYVKNGDILISSANSWELVGKCVRIKTTRYKSTIGGFISMLRPKVDLVDPDYLFYFLSMDKTQKSIRHLGKQTTNISNLDRVGFLQLKIPLPPLETQKQIAAVLEKADQLRKDCQQMEQELNSLAQSVFIDMFGDPVTNPKGWACPKLSSIVREIQSGQSPKCDSRPANNGEWGVLKLSSVTGGFYKPSENKAILEGTNPDPNIEVHAGDLLFTRKNTYELVGACAYVRDSTKRLMLPDLIFRFDMPSDLKIYFWGLLNNKNFRLQIKNLASGAAGSMPNISKSRLNDLDVLIPSMDMISKYTSTVSNIWQQLDILSELKLSYGNNFDALMQKAFSGELNLANAKT